MSIIKRNFNWLVLAVFAFFGLALYGNSLSNEMFWDDEDMIINNVYIKDFSYIPQYFSQNLIAGAGQVSNYWRPALLLSFAVDYHFFGLNPVGYHLVNILWHVLAAWLVFLLLYRLVKNKWAAFLPAIFFLIHPLQTEAVTYISGRADPMSASLILLTLFLYVLFRQTGRKKWLTLGFASFFLSLLTKEQSIMLPALIMIIEAIFFFDRRNWKKSLLYVALFSLVSVVYFLARVSLLDFNSILSGTEYSVSYDASVWVRLLTFTYVFTKYLSLIFFPFNLHMAYEVDPVTSLLSWPVFTFIFLSALLFWLVIRYWNRERLISFGVLWFLVLLLPRTNIISINRPLYEHWLYLPMVGLFLALFLLLSRCKKLMKDNKIVFVLFLFLLLGYFSFLTVSRNKIWRDPITFYEYNLRYTPNSYIQYNNLGMAYAKAGRFDEAIEQYKIAIAIKDVYPQVHFNLGNALASIGQVDEATSQYYQALDISPTFSLPYNNLISLALSDNNLLSLDKVLMKIRDNFPEEYYLKQSFFAYYYIKEYEKARDYGRQYITRFPDDSEIGLLMLGLGK